MQSRGRPESSICKDPCITEEDRLIIRSGDEDVYYVHSSLEGLKIVSGEAGRGRIRVVSVY